MDKSAQLSKEQQEKLNKARGSIDSQVGIKDLIALKRETSGAQNIYSQDLKSTMAKALGNQEAFKQAIDNDNVMNRTVKDKIKEVLSSQISPEEKDILITALIK